MLPPHPYPVLLLVLGFAFGNSQPWSLHFISSDTTLMSSCLPISPPSLFSQNKSRLRVSFIKSLKTFCLYGYVY
jgi:hypothetical protein